jgi:hypothetical protein
VTQLSLADCPHRPGTDEWARWQRSWLGAETDRRRSESTFGLTHEEYARWKRGEAKDVFTSSLRNVGVIPSCNPLAFTVAKYTAGPKRLPWVIIWHSVRYGPVIVYWERHPPFPHPSAGVPWITDYEIAGYQTRPLALDALRRMLHQIETHPKDLRADANGGDVLQRQGDRP